ncbi:hypothetical protein SLE2022_069980 [Rubroshorea leprosula]
MVLSNKKLKQKLRVELLSKSINGPDSRSNSDPDSQRQSLKALIDSVTQKPRLSKREKRRKIHSLQGSESLGQNSNESEEKKEGDLESMGVSNSGDKSEKKKKGERKGNKVEEVIKEDEEREDAELEVDDGEKNKKKKRKRKREEGTEDGAVKEVQTSKKKNKNKKKKGKNKEEKNASNEEGAMDMDTGADSQISDDVATKVYVGGIPYYYTEEDIRHYFEGCGTITEVDCMKFPDSGKFRGIAMISFETEASAKRALALDRAEMCGLQLTIQPYKRTRSNNKISNFAPRMVEGYNRIYVGNLSWDITEEDLRKLFSDCSISSIRFGMDKDTGEFRGYAHVDFADSVSVAMALKLDQDIVCGRPVKISCAVPNKGVKTHSRPQPSTNSTNEVNNDVVSSTSGKMRRRTCYECGEKGHISSACPKKQAADVTKSDTA